MTDVMTMLAKVDPDYPGRFARRFIPPGYIGHDEVLRAVADHLFADAPDQEMSEAETTRVVLACINYLRGLMFAGKIRAFYPFHSGLVVIETAHWLKEECVQQLLMGEVSDGWSLVPLLFADEAIEAALGQAPSPSHATIPSAGGRPRKVDDALAAYDKIYPEGHRKTGDVWKEVVDKIKEITGEKISVTRLRGELKTRQKPAQNPA